jgi:hypothetical protein
MRFVIKPAGMIAVAAALAGLGYLAFGPMSAKNTSRAESAPAPVYLNNADFERVYSPFEKNAKSGSKADSEWANLTLRYADESRNPHGGATCQRIEIGDIKEGHVQFAQDVNVTQGGMYHATVWVRASEDTDVEFVLRRMGDDYRAFATGHGRVSKEWRPVEVTGTVGDARIRLMLIAKKPNVTLWVDDAKIEPVKKTTVK